MASWYHEMSKKAPSGRINRFFFIFAVFLAFSSWLHSFFQISHSGHSLCPVADASLMMRIKEGERERGRIFFVTPLISRLLDPPWWRWLKSSFFSGERKGRKISVRRILLLPATCRPFPATRFSIVSRCSNTESNPLTFLTIRFFSHDRVWEEEDHKERREVSKRSSIFLQTVF